MTSTNNLGRLLADKNSTRHQALVTFSIHHKRKRHPICGSRKRKKNYKDKKFESLELALVSTYYQYYYVANGGLCDLMKVRYVIYVLLTEKHAHSIGLYIHEHSTLRIGSNFREIHLARCRLLGHTPNLVILYVYDF